MVSDFAILLKLKNYILFNLTNFNTYIIDAYNILVFTSLN